MLCWIANGLEQFALLGFGDVEPMRTVGVRITNRNIFTLLECRASNDGLRGFVKWSFGLKFSIGDVCHDVMLG